MVNVLRFNPGARRDDQRGSHAEETGAPGNSLIQLPTAAGDADTPTRSTPDRDITIRMAGVRDMLHIRSVDLTYRLNQPESMLANRNPLARVANAIPIRGERKPATLLAEFNGELLGYCEFRPLMPDRRWQLSALGLVSLSDDPQEVWVPLLEAGTRQAGSGGVKRLYARAPIDSPVGGALRRAGYVPYARERVFVTTAYRSGSTELSYRRQERTDTWAVHQLYNHSVPRDVLNVEAYTSHRWELAEGRSEETGTVRAWIHEDRTGPVIYIRSESARRRHVLDVIYLTGRAADAVSMIDALESNGALDLTSGETYLAVRSYNAELEQMLVERDFGLWLEQDLYIRYTTAPLRVQAADAVLLEAELERSPKHIPAYYAGSGARIERSKAWQISTKQQTPSHPVMRQRAPGSVE